METQPIASIKPAENSDDNSTGIIVLGILIPLAIILLLFLIYHFRKQRNEKTQSTPYKTMRDGTQVLDAGEDGVCLRLTLTTRHWHHGTDNMTLTASKWQPFFRRYRIDALYWFCALNLLFRQVIHLLALTTKGRKLIILLMIIFCQLIIDKSILWHFWDFYSFLEPLPMSYV